MFGRGLILTISVIIVLGLRGGALQSSMTEDEYDAAMKRIRMTAGDADGHIDARYFPELEESGQALASLFGQVEAFWTARNTEAAAEIARTALTATEAMTAAARRDDRDAARNAYQALRGTCGACHQDFREETEDGFRLKPGA